MDEIDRIRAFNRSYTRWLGLLDRSFLGSGMPLAEVRVLHDVAETPGVTARALAGTLGLDEGYLSRILARFAERGWVVRTPDPADRRRVGLSLTEMGGGVVASLREASRGAIGEATEAPAFRGEMAALADRMRALIGGEGGEVKSRDLAPGDAGWVVMRHAEFYAEHEGFGPAFETLVSEVVTRFLATRGPRERAWIAHRGGRRLGSVFLADPQSQDGFAQLRLFYLEPEARGLGLGSRLFDGLVAEARRHGYAGLRLWTHESHRAAGALYAAKGMRETGRESVNAFGVPNVRVTWEMPF